jgi:carbamoyltransferase
MKELPMKLQNILGISAGFHDAAATVINSEGEILFAGHSERYSKKKNDASIDIKLVREILNYSIDHVAYYERLWVKQLRNLRTGQGIDWNSITARQVLTRQLPGMKHVPNISTYNHHLSHAAAGFQTSPYDRATVVIIDAIGEFDTVTIWGAEYDKLGKATYKRLWGQRYPHSIGLFYSAITKRVGLHPLDEEYITMGMSAYGTQSSVYAYVMKQLLVDSVDEVQFKQNLHVGVDDTFMYNTANEDLAGAAQLVAEELIYSVMRRAQEFNWSSNLVYMGGVALNCLANRNLGEYFENIWIMPCPGDAGSSLGAAALAYGKRLHWRSAFLGHEISGTYPVGALVDHLQLHRIAGVASGRAEFGPRALGNRSLLADPRGVDIKDQVNEIKRRQKFRPFAPVILEEHVLDYFDMPSGWSDSRYMQIVGRCRRPDLFPAVCHVDGTSRIQTVPADGSGIRQLLEAWHRVTGCPMLLNTSLNIRGEPMVNDRDDADRFETLYNVKVFS